MSKCKKCGGSGDMFVLSKGDNAPNLVIVAFREIKKYEQQGFKPNGQTLCCSVCNGLGVEDV